MEVRGFKAILRFSFSQVAIDKEMERKLLGKKNLSESAVEMWFQFEALARPHLLAHCSCH